MGMMPRTKHALMMMVLRTAAGAQLSLVYGGYDCETKFGMKVVTPVEESWLARLGEAGSECLDVSPTVENMNWTTGETFSTPSEAFDFIIRKQGEGYEASMYPKNANCAGDKKYTVSLRKDEYDRVLSGCCVQIAAPPPIDDPLETGAWYPGLFGVRLEHNFTTGGCTAPPSITNTITFNSTPAEAYKIVNVLPPAFSGEYGVCTPFFPIIHNADIGMPNGFSQGNFMIKLVENGDQVDVHVWDVHHVPVGEENVLKCEGAAHAVVPVHKDVFLAWKGGKKVELNLNKMMCSTGEDAGPHPDACHFLPDGTVSFELSMKLPSAVPHEGDALSIAAESSIGVMITTVLFMAFALVVP